MSDLKSALVKKWGMYLDSVDGNHEAAAYALERAYEYVRRPDPWRKRDVETVAEHFFPVVMRLLAADSLLDFFELLPGRHQGKAFDIAVDNEQLVRMLHGDFEEPELKPLFGLDARVQALSAICDELVSGINAALYRELRTGRAGRVSPGTIGPGEGFCINIIDLETPCVMAWDASLDDTSSALVERWLPIKRAKLCIDDLVLPRTAEKDVLLIAEIVEPGEYVVAPRPTSDDAP